MKKIILITMCVFVAFAGGGFYYHILTKAELLRLEKPIPFESFWAVEWKGRKGQFHMVRITKQNNPAHE